VLLRCDGCENLHLIADNLDWFKDGGTNIEQILAEQGKRVHKGVTDGGDIEFNMHHDLEVLENEN